MRLGDASNNVRGGFIELPQSHEAALANRHVIAGDDESHLTQSSTIIKVGEGLE